ncbi:hypothetical protein [Roseobacter litoralis]|uniref:hypothetical protein n=1 Tax=Roseobacter litoralis TaxID=42443 RepID=UPI002492B9B9|nr:hypothetical protein [Roseobacter litoralis]
MHSARLATSPRLQRTLDALRRADGEISTYDLSRSAKICAVNSCVAELRVNGAEITCRQQVENGKRTFYYTLLNSPESPK